MSIRLALCGALLLCFMPVPALAQEASKDTRDPGQIAADACEEAVGKTVERMRGKDAQRVQFIVDKRDLSQVSNAETGVKGEGQYQNPKGDFVPFSYSCVFNVRTGKTSGVRFQETAATPPPS